MIKNFSDTISLLSLFVILILTLKIGIGWMFSLHRNDTLRGNIKLFKNYTENEEE